MASGIISGLMIEALTKTVKYMGETIEQQKETIAKYEKLLSSFTNEDYPSEDTEDTKEEGYVEK